MSAKNFFIFFFSEQGSGKQKALTDAAFKYLKIVVGNEARNRKGVIISWESAI